MLAKESEIFPFLRGGGEMGRLIRTKDWSTTPIGLPETWPISLRASVGILLNSQFPMFVWWGEQQITIYNDSYSLILGEKHPNALGQSGPKVWSEIWDVVGPLADQVRNEGRSNWAEDQLLYINRRGHLEESYFTFSYSPILEQSGKVGGVFCACTETTQKVLANRKLKESEQCLRNMILQAPVAMCILRGEQLNIEVANEKMFELWGLRPEGLLGMPLFEAVREARNEGYEELMVNVLKTGNPIVGTEQTVSLLRNGRIETVYINFSFRAIKEVDHTISGVMVMATDVTEQVLARKKIEELVTKRTGELREANEALIKTNAELQRSNANLEEFAYAASHDLKEPIRKVLIYLELLKNGLKERMNEIEMNRFERMVNAADRMRLLVDDLLMYSHATENPIEKEEVDLSKKLSFVLADLELAINEKKAIIKVGELPIVKGYRRQLQQLFYNLVSNALKYSKANLPPDITITAQLVKGNEMPIVVLQEHGEYYYYHVKITDNGIGFEPKNAERIFKVFHRLHGKSEYEGTGVGLSIARKVVENHNGYIWATGEPGIGATFNVLLPTK